MKSIYYGVGSIENELIRDNNGQLLRSYICWRDMLKRCYSEKIQEKRPTYKGCTVSKEWHKFSNFKKWYNNNYYEIDKHRMTLDKDILIKNNKVYSEDTCIFVPMNINNLFTRSNSTRNNLPIGVCFDKSKNKYKVTCSVNNGKSKNIGTFNSPDEAFKAYKIFKENYIKQVADIYKEIIPIKLYNAMYEYEVDAED